MILNNNIKNAVEVKILLSLVSDYCIWWAPHRLQKPDRSEQSNESGKNPVLSFSFKSSRTHMGQRETLHISLGDLQHS